MGNICSSLLLLILLFPLMAQAEPPAEKTFNTLTLSWENDAWTGSDRDYTNGFKLTWSTPYDEGMASPDLPDWSYPIIARLPLVNNPNRQRAVSLSLGQDIYTPGELSRTDLIAEDRPYAGRLYIAAGVHGRNARQKISLGLMLGVLGPLSLAEETQGVVHELLGLKSPQGWDNQLDNELTVDMALDSRWIWLRFGGAGGLGFDLIPHLAGRIGTANTHANAGAGMRLGWNLPDDFGSDSIRLGGETNLAFHGQESKLHGSDKAGVHFFTTIDAKAVLRDIYLDGNSLEASHSVDRKPFVIDAMLGIVWRYGNIKVTLSSVYRTKQFSGQPERQAFGAISIAWLH